MQEICYYLADDGKKFDNRWDCIEYEERKALEAHKDEFQFYNYDKKPMSIKRAVADDVTYIVVKSDNCAKTIDEWFINNRCVSPFEGVYCECVGTWVYGDVIDRGDEWFKLELEIEQLQTLINEVNQ